MGRRGTFVSNKPTSEEHRLEKILRGKPLFRFKASKKLMAVPANYKVNWLLAGSELPKVQNLLDVKIASIYREVLVSLHANRNYKPLPDTGLSEALLFLLKQRGIAINPSQLIYASGNSSFIAMTLRSLLYSGDVVVMSSAADKFYYQQLGNISAEIKCTGSDSEGLNTAELEKICGKQQVKQVLVRPSADYLQGVALSKKRRVHLLSLAETYNFVILEVDDYPDFSYNNGYLPLICNCSSNRIIYITTLSTCLQVQFQPKIVVGPESFIQNLRTLLEIADFDRNLIMERAIAKVIEQNMLELHLKKLTAMYQTRLMELIEIIDYHLSPYLSY